MVQNLKKVLKSKIFKKNSFLRHEVPFKAKNNREAVVVCAIHVMKRPSNMLKVNANIEINDKIFLLFPVSQINVRFLLNALALIPPVDSRFVRTIVPINFLHFTKNL